MQFEQDITGTIRSLLDRARAVLHADSVVVVVCEDQTFLPPISAPGEPDNERLAVIVRETGLTAPIYERGTAYLQDENQYSEFMNASGVQPDLLSAEQDFWRRESIKSSAIMRLGGEDDPLGVMFVNYRTPQVFDSPTKELIEAFSFMTGVAIRNHRISVENSEFWKQQIEHSLWATIGEIISTMAHDSSHLMYEISARFDSFERLISKTGRIDQRYFQDFLHKTREPLNELIQQTMRIRELRRLDRFSRKMCNIEELIDRALRMMKYRFDKSSILIKRRYAHTPEVICDPNSILHLLLNLLRNAAEAIERKGFITVKTGVKDGHARISISDNGRGIPAQQRSQIFEPFFSTKRAGRGFGLPVSRYIVAQHGGKIEFTSNHKATTFSVYLPIR